MTLFHTLVILIVGLFIFGVLAIVTVRSVQTGVEETVERRATQVTRLLETERPPDDAIFEGFVDDGFLLLIRDAEGVVLAAVDGEPARYDTLDDEQENALWQEVVRTDAVSVQRVRELYGYGMPVNTPISGARVVEVWRSYDEAANEVVPFLPVVTFAIPGLVLLAIGGSWLMARSSMAPVNDIVVKARRIGEHDLSERLPVERPRDELGQLATTFNALIARLEVAFRQREEALRQQRQFVADASHELRTPLTSIEGYARMLRQWGADDPEVTREGAAVIEGEAARMRHLVEGLLNLAHGDAEYALNPMPHDLREIANDAVSAARMAAEGRVRVYSQVLDKPVVTLADRDRIYQVLGILLDNALKHTPEGGSVRVLVRSREGRAEIAVRDTGVGIDPRHLPHIFDRFYRVDTARSDAGSGLGLAIARQIVEQHGGAIDVESQPGVGTTFTVSLADHPPGVA
jgi:two-component system, OmpR family, sensor kinase